MSELKFKTMGWDQYVQKCYPDGIGKEQGEQVKQAFYSGAAVMYVMLGEISNQFPYPLAELVIKALLKEISDEMTPVWKEGANEDEAAA